MQGADDRRRPTQRAGRLREEAHEDESELFERRAEWFQRFHTSLEDGAAPRLRQQALLQAVRLEELPPPWSQVPSGGPPDGFAEVVGAAGEASLDELDDAPPAGG